FDDCAMAPADRLIAAFARPASAADSYRKLSHQLRPALLHHVDPRLGLREGDFTALTEFAATLRT
ncbi:hypothetical protein HLK59_48420, partial [Streptomyces sp. S3(2020)]|nr:hypothetical protein [Streptomyces sp. S3(2020)]